MNDFISYYFPGFSFINSLLSSYFPNTSVHKVSLTSQICDAMQPIIKIMNCWLEKSHNYAGSLRATYNQVAFFRIPSLSGLNKVINAPLGIGRKRRNKFVKKLQLYFSFLLRISSHDTGVYHYTITQRSIEISIILVSSKIIQSLFLLLIPRSSYHTKPVRTLIFRIRIPQP